ncbi:hypothetical protein HanPSC8_Chr03g0133061 [Helianthus annuus]|nr:hypothetical protein HanPSC8_Chr03g0133061 [Helianthus annuus]
MIAAMLPVAPRVPAEFRRVRSAVHVPLWCTSANTEVSIVCLHQMEAIKVAHEETSN